MVVIGLSFRRKFSSYEDGVNLIDDDIRSRERNADVLLNACMDIGLAETNGKLSTWK